VEGRDREGIIEGWLSEQVRQLGGALPAKRASLSTLLRMNEPFVETVSGGKHYFRKEDLERAVEVLGDKYMDLPLFPLVFTLREEFGEKVYIIQGGEHAAHVFADLLDLSSINKTGDGTYYTYKAVVYEFIRRYPSLCVVSF